MLGPKFSDVVLGGALYLAEKERAGCFNLIVLWLSVFCVSSSQ